jgi:NAD(P)H-dependent FMN reductase
MVRVLLIAGSLRARSTNAAVLSTAAAAAPAPIDTDLYDGVGRLPHFNPDDDHPPLPPEVAALRDRIHAAGAVLFCTPEYAGALPGSFKNALDWMIGDDAPGSIYEKPVGWINAAPRGASACAHIPVTSDIVGDDGMVTDAATRAQIVATLEELARAAAP